MARFLYLSPFYKMPQSKLHHRFGSDSHEHFYLPVGLKTLDITVQKPKQMTAAIGLAVATAVAESHEALTDFFAASGYEDEGHVQPEMRIALSGTYLKHLGSGDKRGEVVIGKLADQATEHTSLTVNFGSLHMNIIVDAAEDNCAAIADAIGVLIGEVLATFPACRSEEVLSEMFP